MNIKEIKEANIQKGRTPILILKLQLGDVTLDIDLSIQSHKTVFNSYILRQYSNIDKRLPILVSVVKRWAKTNNLFGGSTNRFNSYALTLFVIQYLQSGVKPAILPYLNKSYPDLFGKDLDVKDFDLETDMKVDFGEFNFEWIF